MSVSQTFNILDGTAKTVVLTITNAGLFQVSLEGSTVFQCAWRDLDYSNTVPFSQKMYEWIKSMRESVNVSGLQATLAARTGDNATPLEYATGSILVGAADGGHVWVAASGTVDVANAAGGDVWVAASATITVNNVTFDAGDKVTVNGVDFVAGVDFGSGDDVTECAELLTNAVNNSADVALDGIITASSALGVVTLTADTSGVAGNAYTLAETDGGTDNFTISGANFTGGQDATLATVEVASTTLTEDTEFSKGGDNDITASNIADAINTASLGVTAAAVASQVTITCDTDGVSGNALTLSITDGNAGDLTVSGATLSGGQDATLATVEVASTTITEDTEFSKGGTTSITATNISAAINLAGVGVTAEAVSDTVSLTHDAGGVAGNAITSSVTDGNAGNMTAAGATLSGGSGAQESETFGCAITNDSLNLLIGGVSIGTVSWNTTPYDTNTYTAKRYFEKILQLGHGHVNRAGVPLYSY